MADQQIGDLVSTNISAFAYKAANGVGSGDRPALFDSTGLLKPGSTVSAGDLDGTLANGNTSDDSIILTGARTTAPAQTWNSLTVTPFARNNVMFLENGYYNSGFKYHGNGLMSGLYMTAGKLQFISAPTGTANAAMTVSTNAEFMNNGLFVNYKGQSFASNSGTNRDVIIFNPNSGADNLGYLTLQPTDATNASTQLHMMPKGTGYGSTFKTGISLWNTDFTADTANYEAVQLNASGASGFILNTVAGGTGTLRPFHFQVANVDAIQIAGNRAVSFNSAYTFPLSAGTANQVLAMPASGTSLIWADPATGGGGGDSQWTLSGTDLYPTTATEIGIGTTSPTFPLHVYRNANSAAYIRVENANTGALAEAGVSIGSHSVSASLFATPAANGTYGVLEGSTIGFYTTGRMAIGIDANQPFVIGTGAGISEQFKISGTGVMSLANLNDSTGVAKMVTVTNGVFGYQAIPSGGGGSGTVTSVAMTVPSFLSVSGSPVTSSGTLAVTLSGTPLPVTNGGTGTSTPTLSAGTGIGITGTWPNQTITNTYATSAAPVSVFTAASTGSASGTFTGTMAFADGESGHLEVHLDITKSDNSTSYSRISIVPFKRVLGTLTFGTEYEEWVGGMGAYPHESLYAYVNNSGSLNMTYSTNGGTITWRATVLKYANSYGL